MRWSLNVYNILLAPNIYKKISYWNTGSYKNRIHITGITWCRVSASGQMLERDPLDRLFYNAII